MRGRNRILLRALLQDYDCLKRRRFVEENKQATWPVNDCINQNCYFVIVIETPFVDYWLNCHANTRTKHATEFCHARARLVCFTFMAANANLSRWTTAIVAVLNYWLRSQITLHAPFQWLESFASLRYPKRLKSPEFLL